MDENFAALIKKMLFSQHKLFPAARILVGTTGLLDGGLCMIFLVKSFNRDGIFVYKIQFTALF